jgi:hypothetical protein
MKEDIHCDRKREGERGYKFSASSPEMNEVLNERQSPGIVTHSHWIAFTCIPDSDSVILSVTQLSG